MKIADRATLDQRLPWTGLPSPITRHGRRGVSIFAIALLLACALGAGGGARRSVAQSTLELVPRAHLGGASGTVAVDGTIAWLAEGPRLVAYDLDPDAALERLGASPILPGVVRDVEIRNGRAWVAAGEEGGLLLLDVSDPAAATLLGSIDTPGAAVGLAIYGEQIALADGEAGLILAEASSDGAPRVVATLPLEGAAVHVAIAAGRAVIATGRSAWQEGWPGSEGALYVVDLAEPEMPTLIGTLDAGGVPLALASSGADQIYAAVRRRPDGQRLTDEALVVVDVDGPGDGEYDPRVLSAGFIGDALATESLATGLAPHGRYVLAGGARLRVVDLYDPTAPVLLRRLDASASAIGLSTAGAVLALPGGGLAVHNTGRGGQLYHRVTQSVPGAAVGLGPWIDPGDDDLDTDDPGLESLSIGLADRHGLWRVDMGGEAGSEADPIVLTAAAAPYRVTSGRVTRVAALGDEPGALLLVDGGAAGAHVDTVAYASPVKAPSEDGAMNAALGLGAWRAGLPPADLAMMADGKHALVLDSSEVVAGPGALSLRVLDLDHLSRPRTVAEIPAVAGSALAVDGDFAYILGNDLSIWSLADDPRAPQREGALAGPADTLAVADGTAYTHDGDVLRVIDVSDPTMPEEVARWPMPGPPRGLDADDRFVAVALGDRGVALVDLAVGPEGAARLETAGEAVAVHLDGDTLWIADGDGGLLALDIQRPNQPAPTATPILSRLPGDAHSRRGSAVSVGQVHDQRSVPGALAGGGTRTWSTQSLQQQPVDEIVIESALGGATTTVFQGEDSAIDLVGRGARIEGFEHRSRQGFGFIGASDPLPGVVRDLAYVEDTDFNVTVYAALAGHGLGVLSYDPDFHTFELLEVLPLLDAGAIAHSGEVLWVAAGASGNVYGVDISDPRSPQLLSEIVTPSEALALLLHGELLIVAQGEDGVAIHDVSDPAQPRTLSTLGLDGRASGMDSSASSDFLLVAAGRAGVHGVDLRDPSAPSVAWTSPQPVDPPVGPVGEAVAVGLGEFGIIVAGAFNPAIGGAGLRALDLAGGFFEPEPPVVVATLSLPGEVHGPLPEDLSLVATGSGGLVAFHPPSHSEDRLFVTDIDAPPGFAGAVAIDDEDNVWLGEQGDQPGMWRARFEPDADVRMLDGVTVPLAPKALAADAGRGWALLEGDLLRAFVPTAGGSEEGHDAGDVGSAAGFGRGDVIPAPGAVALAARGLEAAWVAPAPEGNLEPDLRLVGLGGPRDLAVTRRQPLPGAARDVALPEGEGSLMVAGDDAGLLAIQLAEAGRTPIVWDGALNAPAALVAVAGDTVWVDDGRGKLHRLWLEKPALPNLLGSIDVPGGAPLRDLAAGERGAWLVLDDGTVGFVDATTAITQTSVLTRSLPAPALQIAAMTDGGRAVAAAGEAGWFGLRSPLPVLAPPDDPVPIYIPKAER